MYYDLITPILIAFELIFLQNVDGVTTQNVVMSIFFLIILELGYLKKKEGYFLTFVIYWIELIISKPDHIYYRLIASIFFFISSFIIFKISNMIESFRNRLHMSEDKARKKEMIFQSKQRSLIAETEEREHVAILTERNRIARDIHDHVGHMLSRGILLLGAIKTINSDEKIAPQLQMLDATLNDAMREMRQSVHDLHDDSIDIGKSVKEIIKEIPDFKVSLDIDLEMKLSNEVKLAFIGILREAVANISHHSNGNEAEILLHQILGYTELKIYDNGVIDKDEAQRIISNLCSEDRRESGIGLINIKDRVEDLRGDLNIYMDQGFTLFVRVPIK